MTKKKKNMISYEKGGSHIFPFLIEPVSRKLLIFQPVIDVVCEDAYNLVYPSILWLVVKGNWIL
jgi:hypothetical protein